MTVTPTPTPAARRNIRWWHIVLIVIGVLLLASSVVGNVISFGFPGLKWNPGLLNQPTEEPTPTAQVIYVTATPEPATATPVVVTATPMPVTPEPTADSADTFMENFNEANVDFTGKFGYQARAVVFVMTDSERLSCVVPGDKVEAFSKTFGWDIFNDVFIEGTDTLEVDVVAQISSTASENYTNCWDIPTTGKFYRAMVIGANALGREAELEAATGGTVYTVIRRNSDGKESSVPLVLDASLTEYEGFEIQIVRYQLSDIDIKPAYLFPLWSPYGSP